MKSTKASDIKRDWHLIDLEGKILGRSSTEISNLLMGKSKPYFVKNLDCGDFVVVINSKKVKVTGNKNQGKIYFRHSGYPGGFKKETFADLLKRNPNEIIRHAVKGMLPNNRLKDKMLKRLNVFEGSKHTYEDKIKNQKSNIKNTN